MFEYERFYLVRRRRDRVVLVIGGLLAVAGIAGSAALLVAALFR